MCSAARVLRDGGGVRTGTDTSCVGGVRLRASFRLLCSIYVFLLLEDASILWLTGRWLCPRGINPMSSDGAVF